MATYTSAEQVDLLAITARYGLEDLVLAPLSGGAANSSFKLSSAQGDFVLTVLDNHDRASAERLAADTMALYALGVPTTEVVPAIDGSTVVGVQGHLVVVKRWIEGRVHDPLPVNLLPEAGRILARLHGLAPDTPGLRDLPVGTRRLSADQRDLIRTFSDREFADWLIRRLDRIRVSEETHQRPLTIAHGDLFADNVIVRADGGLSVLDWETVSVDDPLLDLGMAAVGLAMGDGVLASERVHALVEGYSEVRALPASDVSALRDEIEHAALIIAFHRYYRHNIRFPDPEKSAMHLAMVRFVESIEKADLIAG